jgi:hypothetical protein
MLTPRTATARIKTLAERWQAWLEKEFSGEMATFLSGYNATQYGIDDGQYGAIEDKTPDIVKADNQGWENL